MSPLPSAPLGAVGPTKKGDDPVGVSDRAPVESGVTTHRIESGGGPKELRVAKRRKVLTQPRRPRSTDPVKSDRRDVPVEGKAAEGVHRKSAAGGRDVLQPAATGLDGDLKGVLFLPGANHSSNDNHKRDYTPPQVANVHKGSKIDCAWCGTTFTATKVTSICCTRECYNRWYYRQRQEELKARRRERYADDPQADIYRTTLWRMNHWKQYIAYQNAYNYFVRSKNRQQEEEKSRKKSS